MKSCVKLKLSTPGRIYPCSGKETATAPKAKEKKRKDDVFLALPDLEIVYKVILELQQSVRNRVSLAGPIKPISGSPHLFLTNTILW